MGLHATTSEKTAIAIFTALRIQMSCHAEMKRWLWV